MVETKKIFEGGGKSHYSDKQLLKNIGKKLVDNPEFSFAKPRYQLYCY